MLPIPRDVCQFHLLVARSRSLVTATSRVGRWPYARWRPALALILALMTALPPGSAHAQAGDQSSSGALPDFPIANGSYFSEAAGHNPAIGYTITNEQGIPFWDTFQKLGGVQAVGYPSTGRFLWDGFVDQATQRLIFQWNPAIQQVQMVNVFDLLEQHGLDGWLLAKRQIPPSFDNRADAGKSWAQIVARHQAELDWNPAIKARYFADPNAIADFGLPQSYADEGNVFVVRCQRAVFQQWKVAVPWAHAGEVTVANGGDIAKEAGILPAGAAKPTSADGLIVAPLNIPLALAPAQEQAVRAVAASVLPALALIESDVGNGVIASGSGVIIDPNGLVVTDAHVVAGARRTVVALADGRALPAQLVGQDTTSDVAVLRIPATGLPTVQASITPVQPDSEVVAVGFSDTFPSPPTIRAGTVIMVVPEQLNTALVNLVVDDLYTSFGDSGGPVLNMRGHVIGLVDAGSNITIQGEPLQVSFETGFASIQPIIRQIVATGQSIIRPVLGFRGVTMTPTLATRIGLPNVTGVAVLRVDPNGAAAQAGLLPGDIVTTMGGIPTPDVSEVATVLNQHRPGDHLLIRYVDPNGSAHTTILTLGAA